MAECREYKTVSRQGHDEFVEKKSRFIGYCAPVKTAEEAMDFVKSIKKKHNDARHNCFAYSLKDGSMRYSDDGEPQGTAGQPMLEMLTKSGITDCVVVVTRYFGGVLLGTGGLSRAYTNGAKIAINASIPIEMIMARSISFSCDYSLYGSVQTLVSKHGAIVDESDFANDVSLSLTIEPDKYNDFCVDLTELCAGKIKIVDNDEKYLEKSLFL